MISFPLVTLVLKILLQQTKLDKPYSGGIGSYKLYVMIAYHYQQHLELGGSDSAAEMLISFLYRYSDIKLLPNMNPKTQTDISSPTIILCDGGEADLNGGVKLDRCVRLFGECFNRLMYQLLSHQNDVDVSMIASLIEGPKLKHERVKCIEMSAQWKKMKSQIHSYSTVRSIRDTFNAAGGITFSKSGHNLLSNGLDKEKDIDTRGMARGPRGGLIPKCRPDIDAKPKANQASLFLRGRKNRKNKKKQKRDEALREFATNNSKGW